MHDESTSTARITDEVYVTDRLQDQITWYDKKSQSAKRWFHGLRSVEIIAAAAIPFLVGLEAPLFIRPQAP